MRLWHYKLLPLLPRQQLLGQHRECCALRGNGWDKKHSTVQYALNAPYEHLVCFHFQVITEMEKRGYTVEEKWMDSVYRGKSCKPMLKTDRDILLGYDEFHYPEHTEAYLQECINNLKGKGITV